MIHMKIVKRVNPKSSHYKKKHIFSFSFFSIFMKDVRWAYRDHFTMFVSHMMLRTLNIQVLHVNDIVIKLEKKLKPGMLWPKLPQAKVKAWHTRAHVYDHDSNNPHFLLKTILMQMYSYVYYSHIHYSFIMLFTVYFLEHQFRDARKF